jgi:hypothetical protein
LLSIPIANLKPVSADLAPCKICEREELGRVALHLLLQAALFVQDGTGDGPRTLIMLIPHRKSVVGMPMGLDRCDQPVNCIGRMNGNQDR